MKKASAQNLLNELNKLSKDYDIKMNPDLKLGIRVSQEPKSVFGEKTKDSIIDKMYRKVLHEGKTNYTIPDMPDLIRTTAVVENYEHVPYFLDIMKAELPDMTGMRPIYPVRGYKGTHLDYFVDGLLADTQIVSPIQGIVDSFTHQLYSKLRSLPKDSPERKSLEELTKHVYDRLFEATNFLDNDLVIRSKFVDYNNTAQRSGNSSIFPKNIANQLSIRPYSIKNNNIVFDKARLEDQAEMAQDYAIGKQSKLVALNEELFGQYSMRRQQSAIETTMTKNQWAIYMEYVEAIKKRQAALETSAKGHSKQYFKDNYSEEIKNIEDKYIFPNSSKRAAPDLSK